MVKAVRFPVAALASIGATLVIGNISAFAYPSGSLGYDIGYPQCGISFPRTWVAAAPSLIGSRGPWWSTPRNIAPTRGSSATSIWYRGYYSFGIIGVDSGYPFLSPAHPGNPCLAAEYARAPNPGLYINSGYDPSYTDSNHTTPDCQTQSGSVSGTTAQKAAWAVGCSEAQGSYGYASSRGITSAAGWWLDVETQNSWCGQPGTACTDLTLNQYTLQGVIDTLGHIGAVPIGIYSNRTQWSSIVGNLSVTGSTSDWVATGARTAQEAVTYCASTYSFSGSPVTLVQFVSGSIDRDVAC